MSLFYYPAIAILTLVIIAFIRSLFECLKYKLLYRDKVIIFYFPISGVITFEIFGIYFKKDCLYYFKKAINQNPNAKAVVVNLLFHNIVTFFDPEYIKEFSLKHEEFKKWKFVPDQMLLSKGIFFSEG